MRTVEAGTCANPAPLARRSGLPLAASLHWEAPSPDSRESLCCPFSCRKIHLDSLFWIVSAVHRSYRSTRVITCFPRRLGFAPRVNGNACQHPEESYMVPGSDSDTCAVQAGQQLEALGDLAARSGSADPALSCRGVHGPSLYTQQGQPRRLALEQVAALPTEDAQGHSSDLNAGGSLWSQGLCSSLMSLGGVASPLPGGSGNTELGELHQVPGSHVSGQQSSSSEALLPGAAAPPLEKVLSLHTAPMHCARSTVSELGPELGQDGSLSTEGGLRSHVGGLDQFPCGTGTHTDQRDLESVVAVGEAMAFEIANGCHELLSQGQEQIFIQTSDGLILSHPGSIMSGEDIVILTEVEGTALQMGPLKGVPLKTMEAEPSQ